MLNKTARPSLRGFVPSSTVEHALNAYGLFASVSSSADVSGSSAACRTRSIDQPGLFIYDKLPKREKLMNRIFVVAGLLFLGSACATGSPGEIERAEEMEQTAGDERAMMGAESGEVDGMMSPYAEEDVEMETEPYPE